MDLHEISDTWIHLLDDQLQPYRYCRRCEILHLFRMKRKGSCRQQLPDKEIFSYVANLDASQVTLGLRVWAKTSDYWTVKFDLTEAIKNELDANNIEIPFNQLVVHVEDSNANIK